MARTGEIGLIAVTAAEKFRGGTRLTFVCGGRALRALRAYRDAIAGSIRSLSVLPHELPAAVEKIQAEGKQARKTIARLQSDWPSMKRRDCSPGRPRLVASAALPTSWTAGTRPASRQSPRR